MLQKSRTGGGAKFALDAAAVDGNIPEDMRRCRSRNRQNAVGTAHLSAAYMNRRCDDLVCIQFMHQQTHSGNIRNGIHGADFMEMDLLNRNTMDMTFRLGDLFIYGHNIQFYHRRNCQTADDTADIPHTAMMVMMVIMHMLCFFSSMDGYPDVGSVDSAFCASLCYKRDTGDAQPIQFFQKAFPVGMKFQ